MTSETIRLNGPFKLPNHNLQIAAIPPVVVALSILFYFFLSISNLRFPGLYYDEALFINAALGGKYNNEFVAARVFDIPVMTMPYIGALKSLVFSPIFALLGVNISTIRVPAILISCVTLVICYFILKRFVSAWIAAFTVLLLATDPAFVLHTRVDHGPIVMMLLLKLAAIYFFLGAVSRTSWKVLSLSYCCLLLGLWDKLNFAWVIVASVLASAIYSRGLVQIFLRSKLQTVLVSLLFAGGLGFMYVALIRPLALESSHPVFDVSSRFVPLASACQSTLTGDAFCSWVFDQVHPRFWAFPDYFVLILISIICGVCAVVRHESGKGSEDQSERLKGICFFAVMFYAIFFQIVLTPQAGGPHHFMVVWPFHYFVGALAFGSLYELIKANEKIGLLTSFCLVIGVSFLCSYRALAITSAISAFKTEKVKAIWSSSIYPLARLLRGTAYGNCWIVTVDWGIGTQISALTHPFLRFKYRDLWTMFNLLKSTGREADWLAGMAKAGPIYMVLYAPNLAVFPEARENLFKFVKAKHLHCALFAEVKDSSNRCFEVYEVSVLKALQP